VGSEFFPLSVTMIQNVTDGSWDFTIRHIWEKQQYITIILYALTAYIHVIIYGFGTKYCSEPPG
jgi:hypothetical protein